MTIRNHTAENAGDRTCLADRARSCDKPPTFDVIYLSRGKVVDRHPACFEHGLAEVDRAHASGSIAEARLVDAGASR